MARFILKILFISVLFISCESSSTGTSTQATLKLGAEQLDAYLPQLQGKRVGLIVNNTAVIHGTHLVDTLKSSGVTISAVFAPEHGFRGEAADGAAIEDGVDTRTGLQIRSLYGSTRKPTKEMLADIDVLVFDIQDVGTRFYTFISTMHLAMEAAAENDKEFIVLDRPNPNGNYVDGPVRDEDQKSFVGMHPIPIVHGLTVGELATMINGEGWLENGIKCKLQVVKMKGYSHANEYTLPIKPSPNLPTQASIILYPSLCLFEGTAISVGRGTYQPFQQIGHPSFESKYSYSFTPVSIAGMSTSPPHLNATCYGLNLVETPPSRELDLSHLIEFYQNFENKEEFFNNYFQRLAGTTQLREQIEAGMSEGQIRASWEPKLSEYRKIRQVYLQYP